MIDALSVEVLDDYLTTNRIEFKFINNLSYFLFFDGDDIEAVPFKKMINNNTKYYEDLLYEMGYYKIDDYRYGYNYTPYIMLCLFGMVINGCGVVLYHKEHLPMHVGISIYTWFFGLLQMLQVFITYDFYIVDYTDRFFLIGAIEQENRRQLQLYRGRLNFRFFVPFFVAVVLFVSAYDKIQQNHTGNYISDYSYEHW